MGAVIGLLLLAAMPPRLHPILAQEAVGAGSANGQWPTWAGSPGGTRYSPLDQIRVKNVKKLKVGWSYRPGYTADEIAANGASFEATPILIEGQLVLSTPFNEVIALDPRTGAELWRYDPGLDRSDSGGMTSRGVSAWTDAAAAARAACSTRIFVGTVDARLIALDATTGSPCAGFGSAGEVDLTNGIKLVDRNQYRVTSPPAIAGDLVIVGSSIGDNRAAVLESGIVRAFDARTGKLAWSWNPLPRNPKREAGETAVQLQERLARIKAGAANAWSGISVDPERGLIFVPTSSASPDYYGGKRDGDNLFANSVVALRASSGKKEWHFQVVHHDLWDYDIAAQPALVTITPKRGPAIDAVAVATKTGYVFVLERDTGEPLFPVEEREVPQDPVSGERLAATQPFPTAPPALVSNPPTPDTAFGIDEADRAWCRQEIEALRDDGLFTPPSEGGSLVFPMQGGGANWGGTGYDPELNLLVVNTNRIASAVRLIPRGDFDPADVAAWRANNATVEIGSQDGTPYVMRREFLVSRQGVPCNEPPWGELAAVDLSDGTIRWQVPLGRIAALDSVPGSSKWGSLNLGGPLVTGGGLIFIAATLDSTVRAFDLKNGKVKWSGELPAGGQSSPMTYEIDGKQYVVIVAGGHSWLMPDALGDYVIAYSLP